VLAEQPFVDRESLSFEHKKAFPTYERAFNVQLKSLPIEKDDWTGVSIAIAIGLCELLNEGSARTME